MRSPVTAVVARPEAIPLANAELAPIAPKTPLAPAAKLLAAAPVPIAPAAAVNPAGANILANIGIRNANASGCPVTGLVVNPPGTIDDIASTSRGFM